MATDSYRTPCSVAESCDVCPLRELSEETQQIDTFEMAMSSSVLGQIIEFRQRGIDPPRDMPHSEVRSIPITGIDQMIACADKIIAGECQLPEEVAPAK